MVGTIFIEARRPAAAACSRGAALAASFRARAVSHLSAFGSRTSGRRRRLLSFLGMACALAVGCDKSEEASQQSRSCARFCELLEKCDDGTDLLDCTEHCESDEVRSAAYFRARADCGQELSCNQWMSEVDSQGDDLCSGEDCNLSECVDHALREEKLSADQERKCEVISSALSHCDSSLTAAAVADECERMAPGLSENYLEDSETCVLSECSKIGICLDDLADRQGTDLKVFSGAYTPR
jgi:hypothetical protein